MYPYVNSALVYKCPSDPSTVFRANYNPWGGPGVPRVRSVSMNEWVCSGTNVVESANPDPNVYQFRKTLDITRPQALGLLGMKAQSLSMMVARQIPQATTFGKIRPPHFTTTAMACRSWMVIRSSGSGMTRPYLATMPLALRLHHRTGGLTCAGCIRSRPTVQLDYLSSKSNVPSCRRVRRVCAGRSEAARPTGVFFRDPFHFSSSVRRDIRDVLSHVRQIELEFLSF
jgi:hypothetical protein